MRHTEFWARMEAEFGPAYARTWASDQHLGDLGGRTVLEALADGEDPKLVWRAVWAVRELPDNQR